MITSATLTDVLVEAMVISVENKALPVDERLSRLRALLQSTALGVPMISRQLHCVLASAGSLATKNVERVELFTALTAAVERNSPS